jgi:hypothetical protein
MWPIWLISCCVAQSVHKLHLTLASNTTKEAPSHQSAAATRSCTGKVHQRGTRQRRERAMQEPPKHSHIEEAPCCRPDPAAAAQFQPPPPPPRSTLLPSSSSNHRPVPCVDACEALLGCLCPKFQTQTADCQSVTSRTPGDTPGCLTDTTDAPRMP